MEREGKLASETKARVGKERRSERQINSSEEEKKPLMEEMVDGGINGERRDRRRKK